MRVIAAILVFTTAVIQLLLGAAYAMSSRHVAPVPVAIEGGPLTSDKAQGRGSSTEGPRARAESAPAKTHLVVGVLLLVLAPVEVLGGVLVLRRRRGAAALLLGLGGAGLVASMAAAGVTTVAAISVCLIAAAAGLTALTGRSRRPVT